MSILLLGIVAIGTVVWFSRWLNVLKIPKGDIYLREDNRPYPDSNLPFVSILVPARNEEKDIAACVNSLLQQDYPDFEIIVIDDRSTDGTSEILEELGHSTARTTENSISRQKKLRILKISELPHGWTGKTHALHEGNKIARGRWFFFTDADTIHRPLSLKSSITYALERKIDLLSLYPRSRNVSFCEKITQPLGGGILAIWYPFEKVNNPGYKTAFANGQYILINTECYLELGGHEGVKGELLEDVAMAEKAKERNKNIRMAYGFNLFSTRMYKDIAGIWKGWRRIFNVLMGKKKIRYPASLALIILFSLVPFLLLFNTSLIYRGDIWTVIYFTDILEIVFLYLTIGFIYHLSRNNPAWAIFHPVGCLIMAGIILDALVREITRKPITWRGTLYPSR